MKKYNILITILIILLTISAIVIFFLTKDSNTKKVNIRKVIVYLSHDTSDDEINRIENTIKGIHGVIDVQYKSKEDSLNDAKEKLKNNTKLLESWESDNPFRPSFIVSLPADLYDSVTEELYNINGVDDIRLPN